MILAPLLRWVLIPRPASLFVLLAAWYSVFWFLRYAFWRPTVVRLPGTAAHELCHLMVGFVTLARPERFSIIPHKTENGWFLGSVEFERVNLWNGAPTALAPLLLLPIGTKLLDGWAKPLCLTHSWLPAIFATWVIVSCWHSCWPSRQDWRMGGPSAACYAGFFALCWLFGYDLRFFETLLFQALRSVDENFHQPAGHFGWLLIRWFSF
ncbi:MAG: hypothetical protein F8N36_15905 [Desulfovibrio sp.]|uniref:hypothetical protein n=1 Tax=Desulfovibrio sp. TaxID=885 RepID=UPI00135E1670|nr:hypothetical protein [Desulfovibrio sp.]MTJ94323.1 hypothetical protein [Desulfovibrio sp.]